MDKDVIADARERYEAARNHFADARREMLDDLRFSNPANPEQWPEHLRRARENDPGGRRPCLTFDQTNQYVQQVVNDGRQNKPSIKARPVDGDADPQVAGLIDGLFRHIEDASRADIAYDTALEYAARCGLGYLRVSTEVIDPRTNMQDIRILRVNDPLAVMLDPEWTEPDGSDAMWGQIETRVTKKQFEKLYPKAKMTDFALDGYEREEWFGERGVRILEDFVVEETEQNCISIPSPDGSDPWEVSEEQYWQIARANGVPPPVLSTYTKKKRTVRWRKLTAADVLEETEFPAEYVPLIPVIGSEIWIEGKRYLAGLVRRMKDPARVYNYERSSYVEFVSLQPRIPTWVPIEAIEGYEKYWDQANVANRPYLPYRAYDSDGRQMPAPSRQPAPANPSAFIHGAELASRDIQAANGMYRAAIGDNPNQQSGRALNAIQRRADTSTMHYVDNLARSIRHMGRIVLQMIPRVYDTRRVARILGEDGATRMLTIDPSLAQPAQYDRDRRVIAFNPAIGRYDVTVKTGPMFQTRREEAAMALGEMVNGNPQALALLGDLWVKMMDFPEAERVAARLKAALPPEIQQAEAQAEQSGEMHVPPQVQAQLNQAQQAAQQAAQMVERLQAALQEVEQENRALKADLSIKQGELAIKAREVQIKEAETMAKLQRPDGNAQGDAQAAATAQPAMPAEPAAMMPMMTALANVQQATLQMPAMMQALLEAIQASNKTQLAAIQSLGQTLVDQLGELRREVARPREKTVEITSPSGQVYRGVAVEQ